MNITITKDGLLAAANTVIEILKIIDNKQSEDFRPAIPTDRQAK